MKKGFSLIEVLVVIGILAIIGVITSTILTRSHRADVQSETLGKLKQNGEIAMKNMDETIRSAETIVCYGPAASPRKTTLVLRTYAGIYIKFKFIDPVPAPPDTPTTNGFIIRQENLLSSDLANFCETTQTNSPEVPITNKDSISGVSISNGSFLKLTGVQGKDTITIIFNVDRTLKPSSTAQSETAKIQTTVQVR